MGACLPKTPTCGEVTPSTKLFNVCCGGRVIIENSEIDGVNGRKEEHYVKKKQNKKINAVLHSMFYDVSKPSAYTGRTNVYRAARRLLPSITKSDVDRWFEGQLTYTLHRPYSLYT